MNVDKYKQQLLALEQQFIRRMRTEETEAAPDSPEPADSGDQSMADELEDESLTLADADSTSLGEVQLALQRIEAGTFGLCEVDGVPIEEIRLQAVPWARYCLAHQQQLEDAAGQRSSTL